MSGFKKNGLQCISTFTPTFFAAASNLFFPIEHHGHTVSDTTCTTTVFDDIVFRGGDKPAEKDSSDNTRNWPPPMVKAVDEMGKVRERERELGTLCSRRYRW